MCRTEEDVNERPIVGILSQALEGHSPYTTYIMAAYVKFVEQAGARVVPLLSNDTDSDTENMLEKLNGVLLPGGDIVLQHTDGSLTEYGLKGKFILDYAKKMNEDGTYYPVWAICQGFEQLSVIEAPKPKVLVQASAQHIPLNVEFVKDPSKTRMFANMPDDLIKALENDKIAYHNNEFRVDPSTFEEYDSLKEYDVLAISHDRDDRPMVASIEHKKYPIYSHQYHPEKNEFIWVDSMPIPHSKMAIKLVQFYSEFFVSECRKNHNKFPSYEEERLAMIQNHPVVVRSGSLQDIYLF